MNGWSQQKSLKIKVSSSAVKNIRAKVLGRSSWILGVGSGGGRTLWEGGKEARADLPQEHSPRASHKAEKEPVLWALHLGGATGTKGLSHAVDL